MSPAWSLLILTWAAIALLGLALAGLVRQVHQLAKIIGPGGSAVAGASRVRSPAPPLEDDINRAVWPVPTVALFVDLGCGACEAVLPRFSELAETHASDELEFVAVYRGTDPAPDIAGVRVVANSPGAFSRFRVSVTPYAVSVDQTARIRAAQPVGSAELLTEFIRDAVHDVARR